jgi:hypothetical protein
MAESQTVKRIPETMRTRASAGTALINSAVAPAAPLIDLLISSPRRDENLAKLNEFSASSSDSLS